MSASPTPFKFDAARHEYSVDGAVIPSVTQIIKEFGLVNFDMVPPDVLARKAQLGKLVHQACHFWDENDLSEEGLHPEVAARLEAYKAFRRDTGYTPTVHEFQKIGEVYGMKYGMQFDSMGYPAGPDHGYWLVDIKNGATASPAWGLQLAAYDMAMPATKFTPKPRKRIAVQLFADGRYKLHTYSDPKDYQIFQSLLALSAWKRNKQIA
jgi:hypothetical protein